MSDGAFAVGREPEHVDTWKAIAAFIGRSDRWCRYMSSLEEDPLPVFKLRGQVRLDVAEFRGWVERQKRRPQPLSVRGVLVRSSRPARVERSLDVAAALGVEQPCPYGVHDGGCECRADVLP